MQNKRSKSVSHNSRHFPQPRHWTIWWLIIDNLRLCCFLTPSLSLRLSQWLSLPSLLFLSQRLDTDSNMKAADLCLGLSQVISLLVPYPHPPSTGYSLSLALSLSVCPPYLPILSCYGTCQVATGTLISPLIRLLNPGVNSIQPSFMSENSRSKTPRCLTLQKLTGVSLPSPTSSISFPWKTPLFSPVEINNKIHSFHTERQVDFF